MLNIQVIRKPYSYKSLQTNGTVANGYATIPSISAYGTFADFTIEFWIKRGAWDSSNARLIDFTYFSGFATNRNGTADTLSLGIISSNVFSISNLAQDVWTHLAFVRSGSTGLIYINGVLDKSGACSGGTFSFSGNTTFGVGADVSDSPGNNRQTAKFTDIRFWKIARTQAQIAGNMNIHLVGNEANLIGNWQFINGSAADSTLNKNRMTLLANASISDSIPY